MPISCNENCMLFEHKTVKSSKHNFYHTFGVLYKHFSYLKYKGEAEISSVYLCLFPNKQTNKEYLNPGQL
jgi:hypothetical protein